jgi:hypothetical protein
VLDTVESKQAENKSIKKQAEKKYASDENYLNSGASNLRPRNIFVRPKLDSEFNEKSVNLTDFP